MIIEVMQAFFIVSVCFIVVYLVRHYLFTLTVLKNAKNPPPPDAYANVHYEPTVSILIPAYDEEKVIGKLLQRMTELTYPKAKLEIIVVDDASLDKTGQIIDEYVKRNSFIKVIHRHRSVGGTGKAAALNAGFKYAKGDIIVCFDADYFPRQDIIEKLVKNFANPKVGAVQGRPVVENEPQNMETRLIALERIGGFRVDQEARDILGLIPQFGGTAGGFRSRILANLGGFDESMLTEDTDLTFQIYLEGYKIRYAGNAECYEEAVGTWRRYWRQRHRWALGHMQVCSKHAFKLLKSKKISRKEKLDGLLLLHVYFMPVLTLFAFLVGVPLILTGSAKLVGALWFFVPVSLYSFVGNFAPFFEVGIGAYLDGRKRLQWLSPLLIFAFLFNMLICTKAFFDFCGGKLFKRNKNNWAKTDHLGYNTRSFPSTLIYGEDFE